MGTKGQGLEILECRITIVVIPTGRNAQQRKVQQRPAGFGLFTVGELQRILTDVQLQPFRDKFLYRFPHGKYMVTTYQNDDANPDQT